MTKITWIPVSGHLPRKSGWYIVNVCIRREVENGDEFREPRNIVKVAKYNAKTKKWENEYGVDLLFVTAWADMPGAYKK